MILRRSELSENLARVSARIEACAKGVNRNPDEITLIVVTKTFPASDVEILYDLGLRNFGENRDQEASVKAPQLPDDSIWHFQGQIQSNKLKSITNWADILHSVDQLPHATKLNALGRKKDIFIQVALDQSENRGGVEPAKLHELVESITPLSNLNILGVMAVAPLGKDPGLAFKELGEISRKLSLDYPKITAISAGMSNDFEAAITHGATHIRIGSQILGVR